MIKKWVDIRNVILMTIFFNCVSAVPYMRESNDEQSYIEQEYGNELDSDTYLKYDNGSDEITLTDDQETEPFGIARSGLKDVQYRWPKNTVPYLLDAGDFDGLEKENIKLTLKSIEKVTCVKFIPRTNEKNYVHVTGKDSTGKSDIGFLNKGKQKLNLNRVERRHVLHEFLHTLGFVHMHQSPDRVNHIQINFRNIKDGHHSNFRLLTKKEVTDFGVAYDMQSVMHYSPYAFSKNGQPTIVALNSTLQDKMGQGDDLTGKDILKINKMYNC